MNALKADVLIWQVGDNWVNEVHKTKKQKQNFLIIHANESIEFKLDKKNGGEQFLW